MERSTTRYQGVTVRTINTLPLHTSFHYREVAEVLEASRSGKSFTEVLDRTIKVFRTIQLAMSHAEMARSRRHPVMPLFNISQIR